MQASLPPVLSPSTRTATAAVVSPSSVPEAVSPLSAKAKAAGLIDVRSIIPDGLIDLRYATTDNFTGVQLYPVGARCLVHDSMRPGLVEAARRLRAAGSVLVFWDCYRPHDVQVRMWAVVPDPAWVAEPGAYAYSHEAARSVDVSLAETAVRGSAGCASGVVVQGHCLLDMGTPFDDFTPKATAYATAGLTKAQVANRAMLRTAMAAGGLPVYSGEWWHFNGPGSATWRAHLDVPLT